MSEWRRYLYYAIFGFAFGVLVESLFNFGFGLALLLVALAIATFVFWYFGGKQDKLLLLAILFLVVSSLGSLWTEIRYGETHSFDNSTLSARVVSPSLTATVVEEPDVREANTRLVVKTDFGRVLLFVDHYPEYEYGDVLEVRGTLERPQNRDTIEKDEFFDWTAYLAKEDIYYQVFRPEIKLVSKNEGNFVIRNLLHLKAAFSEKLALVVKEPENSLLGGLLLGAKNSLGKDLLEDFRRSGVTHIIVLSGYNLTIIAQAILFVFLLFLPRKYAFTLAILGIIFFTLMTGAGPATVRAAFMAVIGVMARHSGRLYNAKLALVLAGFVMILWNPKVLVFDVGFQLSFLATLGLIYIAPVIESKLGWFSKKLFLRELLVTTVSAQLAVLPWLLYKIGDLSLVALPVNLIILGLIPATMLFGFIAGTLGFVSIFLSTPFGWICYIFLWFELAVIKFFANLPFASVHIANFPLIMAILAYAGYIWAFAHQKESEVEPNYGST